MTTPEALGVALPEPATHVENNYTADGLASYITDRMRASVGLYNEDQLKAYAAEVRDKALEMQQQRVRELEQVVEWQEKRIYRLRVAAGEIFD